MKLKKTKIKDKGYMITVSIGNQKQDRIWNSPPIFGIHNHRCDFTKEYLVKRYSFINTKEKAETFSRLYKNLWIEVNQYQLDLMKHCLGINYRKKPFRNYFYISKDIDNNFNDLINKRLAIKLINNNTENKKGYYVKLTRQGAEYVLGKSIGEKFYNKL